MRQTYNKLYRVKGLIQTFFSVPILISFILTFTETVFTVFMTIVKFQNAVDFFTTKQLAFFYFNRIYVIRFILLCYLTDNMSCEMHETKWILTRLVSDSNDERQKGEVNDIVCSLWNPRLCLFFTYKSNIKFQNGHTSILVGRQF